MKKLSYLAYASAACMFLFPACQKVENLIGDAGGGSHSGHGNNQHGCNNINTTFYALTGGIQLDKFNASNPGYPSNTAFITGLQSGETILAIDFRPATGQMYGLGSNSRLYVIEPMSGAARAIGTPFATALSGSIAGFDFNPTVDRIRIVTSTGQNLRVNPETGGVAFVDGSINGEPGAMISGVAYTNNRAGQTTTTLYDLDPVTDKLFVQNPPNNGTLAAVGSLGLNIEGDGGFDISPDQDAFGLYSVNGASTLFVVDLVTGEAEVIKTYSTTMYTAIAIPTKSVAYAVDGSNNLLILGSGGNGFGPNGVVTLPITGLAAGATVVGLDMRPLNGQLYALGSNGVVYSLNASSGLAAASGTLGTTLSGTEFGFDFNPAVDRIRIVSNTGQNLRFNPNDGTTTVDVNLNPGTPMISAVAYSNNVAGTATTTLFAIDPTTDKLYQVNPPNNGTLVTVGNLGVNISNAKAFDIGGTSGNAFAIVKVGGATKVLKINTASGNATQAGSFGNSAVNGFTIGLGF